MGGIGSGGPREGAGRKTIDGDPRSKISLCLPTWLLSIVRDEADHRKISVSQYVSDLIIKGIEK